MTDKFLNFGGIIIKLNRLELCDGCEEEKKPDYEVGDSFLCRECRDEEGIELEDMGVSF
jgi:hypothetical protein